MLCAEPDVGNQALLICEVEHKTKSSEGFQVISSTHSGESGNSGVASSFLFSLKKTDVCPLARYSGAR